MVTSVPHQALLERVSNRLGATNTTTDHLLLTRWRVLGLCQYILGKPDGEAYKSSIEALTVFAREGAGAKTDETLFRAGQAVLRETKSHGVSVLPSIAPTKRDEVLAQLCKYEDLGSEVVKRALDILPSLRDRLRQRPVGALLAGIRHRMNLVAAIAADNDRDERERCRAAAAILYLDEIQDAIPDTLEHFGLLDDDFALRVVLTELSGLSDNDSLHWTERISALWDDLPFLRGVQLCSDRGPVTTTWLDRINSFVSYIHAIEGDEKLLVLVQPSVVCSPLHSIVCLIGLLVLDGLTSSEDLIQSLRKGQVYEIDEKLFVKYGGLDDSYPDRIRLELRDLTQIVPLSVAKRMIPAKSRRRLSSEKDYNEHNPTRQTEIVQRFFSWDEAIGAASISKRVLVVTSQKRAARLFGGIKSNGVRLLDDGLIRFVGLNPNPDILRGGLVHVIPNLTVARQLIDQGVEVQAIIVDGYERLRRGRHDIPFLMKRALPPPIIAWSPAGYYPSEPPSWLPEHRCLQVSSDDLSYILELDGETGDRMTPNYASLWEAATKPGATKVIVCPSAEEQELLRAIEEFMREVRRFSVIPQYWQYHLFSAASMLRSLVTATPAYWTDIREMAAAWKESFDEQWGALRSRVAVALEQVARAHQTILDVLDRVSAERNTKADALLSFLSNKPIEDLKLVCDRLYQLKVIGQLSHRVKACGFEPILLRDLGVCCACIVVGWRNVSFGRRLWAHTPSRLVVLVDESEGRLWDRAEAQAREVQGASLLEVVGLQPDRSVPLPVTQREESPKPQGMPIEETVFSDDDRPRTPCVFIWLADEPTGKALSRKSRVLMESGGQASERLAYQIEPGDNVILGEGSSRWSPAEEFTQAVVEAIEASHPDLVRNAREWRYALRLLHDDRRWSTEDLRLNLDRIGVVRGLQTVEGWLRLEQASPIGPRYIHREISAIWELVGSTHTKRTADEVAKACLRLRSLRSAAGRALLKLWKGRLVDLGVGESWLGELVDQLRQEVQVHEVDAVTFGAVPEVILGWWVTPELAAMFESGSSKPPGVKYESDHDLCEDDFD